MKKIHQKKETKPELKIVFDTTNKKLLNAIVQLAFELGMELINSALKNHKDELLVLMKKRIKGSITQEEIFDRLIRTFMKVSNP